jgi:small subunit ribosomal protein S2
MKELLETGVHFGHRSRKWNPKMDEFIFTSRNGVHIIDLQQTLANLNEVHDMIRDTAVRGGNVLFVGTKRQAQDAIQLEAERSGSPYVNQRWLGGTLTNWKTIKQRIDTLKRLERERDEGVFDLLVKKERLMKQRQIERLQFRLGGLRNMERLPSILFVVDVIRESTAVREANVMGIPVIAMVDTNGDPDNIDYVLPANDDAIRAIRLLTAAIADAVLEGRNLRKDEDLALEEGESAAVVHDRAYLYEDEEDEMYLGQATLAKLREGDLSFDEEEDDDSSQQRKRRK